MRNILLTISYDGSDFCGWQRQDQGEIKNTMRTVQGEVEKALEKLHKQEITLYGSGRTDSGVHAMAQAANFFSPIDSIPVDRYPQALNSFLPQDIRIIDAEEVSEDFNARFSATSRVYRYFICPEKIQASQTRYAWAVNYQPDIDRLNVLSSCLRGELDCASFAASGDESLSTCRYINNAHFFKQNVFPDGKEMLVFEIEANAFLWKMVRTITGTLINLDRTKAPLDSMQKILLAKDRKKAGATAPAHGLFLYKINFDGIRVHK
ncbi:MAG: tRNA pseudouridine(38-40) synthase TruA [Treponema sp.]|nr:tRNA pseudouridine(38-40) synthase TruA [Treponema sp.]